LYREVFADTEMHVDTLVPSWSPEIFMTKLTDMPKECGTVFESIATEFRSAAASRRQVPCLSIEVRMSKHLYETVVKQCHAADVWTTKRNCPDTIQVTWSSETLRSNDCERLGDTLTRNGTSVSSIRDIFVSSETDFHDHPLGYTIYGHRELDKFDIPFGVEALIVSMRHEQIFTKGAFQLTLAYVCEGKTNTEAEECLMQQRGYHKAILELVEPDTILQNRCTDAQLGNALQGRMPNK